MQAYIRKIELREPMEDRAPAVPIPRIFGFKAKVDRMAEGAVGIGMGDVIAVINIQKDEPPPSER